MTAVLNTEPKAHVISNDEEAIKAVWISKPLDCPPACFVETTSIELVSVGVN